MKAFTKYRKTVFYILILLILFNLGCILSQPISVIQSSSNIQNETESNQESESSDDSQARFIDMPLDKYPVNLPILGSVSFTIDSSSTITGEYLADGAALELELTDSNGLSWTLLIPPMAINAPQSIRMTALENVKSDTIPGNLVSGILIEPDGLQFDVPVSLTVTGSDLKGQTFIFGGNQDGSQIDFTLMKNAEEGSGAFISHFSVYTAVDLDDTQVNLLKKQAVRNYKELSDQARQILNNKNIDVPRPPSVPLHCSDKDDTNDNNENLAEFAEEFNDPENVLINKMLSVQANLQLLGEPTDYSLEQRLMERLVKKTRLLIKEYGQEAENLPAISNAALTVIKDFQLLGGDENGSADLLLAELGSMYERAVDELLDELVTEHEYRNIEVIFDVARSLQLLKSDTHFTIDEILKQLEAALHFDLDLTYTLELTGNQEWILQANFPIQYDSAKGTFNSMTGTGTGSLVSFLHEDWPELYVVVPDFEVQATIYDFLPCEGISKISLTQFYPPSETYKEDDPEDPMSIDMPLIKNGWMATFADYMDEGKYTFLLTINNQDIKAVEETIEAVAASSGGKTVGTMEIKLTHSPQKK